MGILRKRRRGEGEQSRDDGNSDDDQGSESTSCEDGVGSLWRDSEHSKRSKTDESDKTGKCSSSSTSSSNQSSRSGDRLRAWEFVVHVKDVDDGKKCVDQIRRRFTESGSTREWVMQVEQGGNSGRIHVQGFVSFKQPHRREDLQRNICRGASARPVHDRRACIEYCQKGTGRVAGPWTSRDATIPRQYRDIELRAWQSTIDRMSSEWDTRHIDVLCDAEGGRGKSTLIGVMCGSGRGRQLPALNTGKDLLRAVASFPISRCYFVDLPRAIGQDAAKWREFYGAMEQLKSGYAYDDRYKFREVRFDCPNIWIMSNAVPRLDLLSRDRWKVWEIDQDHQLVRIPIPGDGRRGVGPPPASAPTNTVRDSAPEGVHE